MSTINYPFLYFFRTIYTASTLTYLRLLAFSRICSFCKCVCSLFSFFVPVFLAFYTFFVRVCVSLLFLSVNCFCWFVQIIPFIACFLFHLNSFSLISLFYNFLFALLKLYGMHSFYCSQSIIYCFIRLFYFDEPIGNKWKEMQFKLDCVCFL